MMLCLLCCLLAAAVSAPFTANADNDARFFTAANSRQRRPSSSPGTRTITKLSTRPRAIKKWRSSGSTIPKRHHKTSDLKTKFL